MHLPSSPINPVKGNIVFHGVCREKMEVRDSPEVRTSNGSKCLGSTASVSGSLQNHIGLGMVGSGAEHRLLRTGPSWVRNSHV